MLDETEQSWQKEASHPETSPQRLIEISADPQLRRVVASNPASPASLLERLAEDQDLQVRQGVAGNPNTPWQTLEHLSWEFPHEFLHNPAGPLQMLAHPEQVSTKDTFWGALLREASLPSLWWSWLKSHPALSASQMVHLHVQCAGEAKHPCDFPQNEEEHVLLTLVELLTAACEQEMYGYALENHAVSAQSAPLCQNIIREYLQRLALGRDPEVRQAAASHPQTPVEVLRRLARDEDPMVRKVVAEQMQTPEEILRRLAQDEDPMVRLAVAEQGKTPGEVLHALAQDEDVKVRLAVAKRPQIPVEILHILTQDEDAWNRSRIASHLQIPVEVLRTLAQDKDMNVRRSVARNPQTSIEVLHQLCLDPDEWVRHAVAFHPQTPEEVLRRLARNVPQNRDVYRNLGLAVAMHPQASAETLRLLTQYPNRQVQWLARFVQKLVAAFGDAGREQAWWAKLRWFFVDGPNRGCIGIMSIETQLDEIATLEVPEDLRQMVITALAADWDSKHTFAVTDKRDAATILRDRLIFYKHLLAPFLPPVALQKLATSPHWDVRYLVAHHENTPWETRQILSQDGNRYVRAMARANRERMSEPAPGE